MKFEEFLEVLDLLKDPSKYEAKVAELQAREVAIQESIKSLGIVGDIAKAKKKAEALVAEAEAKVIKAQDEAEVIVASAQSAFNTKLAALQAKEVVADQALANYNTIKEQTASREAALRVSEKEIEKARAQLTKDQQELATKQAEVDERLAKLRQVMG